jgi:UDP-N-acetylglucosamine:LPS N-acetylglucosamine transferase
MPLLMRAADAFVTATCGLSCLEARVCGTPTVAYGFPVAHVRDNVRLLEQAGVLRACPDPRLLSRVLAEAMASPPAGRAPRDMPAADVAQLILGLAGGEGGELPPANPRPMVSEVS